MDQVTRFRTIGPTTYLCPIPAVMLGCANPEAGAPNLITVAWTGVVCSKPPMLSVSIRKSRLSHDMIARTEVRTFSGKSLPISRLIYPQLQKDYLALLFKDRRNPEESIK